MPLGGAGSDGGTPSQQHHFFRKQGTGKEGCALSPCPSTTCTGPVSMAQSHHMHGLRLPGLAPPHGRALPPWPSTTCMGPVSMTQPHHHISCARVNPGHHPTMGRCHRKTWQPQVGMSAWQASCVPVGVNHGCTSASLAGQACERSLHPLPCPTPSLYGIKSLCGCIC